MDLMDLSKRELFTLSKATGIKLVYLKQIQKGYRRPGPEKAKAISEALNGDITVEELLFSRAFIKRHKK
jgi:DNA-binding transcriptional regulator YdaS (Cro superfamily)